MLAMSLAGFARGQSLSRLERPQRDACEQATRTWPSSTRYVEALAFNQRDWIRRNMQYLAGGKGYL